MAGVCELGFSFRQRETNALTKIVRADGQREPVAALNGRATVGVPDESIWEK